MIIPKLRQDLSASFLIPLGKTLSRRRYFSAKRYQRTLERSQYLDDSILMAEKINSLKKLIKHCYNNVPYYRQLMRRIDIAPKDISGVDDLSRIPLLSKSLLKENFRLLRATNKPLRDSRLEASGGTTGTPIQFARDIRNEYRIDAANWRFGKWAGYSPGMKVAKFWGHLKDIRKSKNLYSRLKLLMENSFILNAFDLSDQNMKKYVDLINLYRPDIFHGYASAILSFTRFVKKQNLNVHKPRSIIITADKIFEKEKVEVSSLFECEVYEEYGCREFSIIGHECEKHSGLHVADEHFIVEVVDPKTKEKMDNDFGEILITSLVNYAMPLIRFSIGDSGRVLNKKCQCGRNLTLIDFILGRVADFILTKSGKKVYGPLFVLPFDNIEGISEYLVEQKEIGCITVKIVTNDKFDNYNYSILKKKFRDTFSNDLDYSIIIMDKLRLSNSGKRRTVISYLGNQ